MRKRTQLAGGSLIFLVSVFCISLPSIFPNSSQKTIVNIVYSIGICVLSALIVTLAYKYFLIEAPTDERVKELLASGIHTITNSRNHKNYSEAIRKAKSVDLIFNTAQSLFKRYEDMIISSYANGCNIRLLISNPTYSYIVSDSPEANKIRAALCPNTNIKAEIDEVVRRATNIIQNTPTKRSSALIVKYAKCFITGSYVIIDNELCDFVPYLPYSHSNQSIRFDFTPSDSKLMERFIHSFDEAWKNGEVAIQTTPMYSRKQMKK